MGWTETSGTGMENNGFLMNFWSFNTVITICSFIHASFERRRESMRVDRNTSLTSRPWCFPIQNCQPYLTRFRFSAHEISVDGYAFVKISQCFSWQSGRLQKKSQLWFVRCLWRNNPSKSLSRERGCWIHLRLVLESELRDVNFSLSTRF